VKKSLNFVVILLALFLSQANASFIDTYDFENWKKTEDGGSITTSKALDSVFLVSSNKGHGSSNQDYTITAVSSGLVSFNWRYLTLDSSKNQQPKADPFGWILNGTFSQLTDNKGSFIQSGFYSFAVTAGDVFGFRANSTNSKNGSAYSVISNFSGPIPAPAAVPLPASFWLMLAPMIVFLNNRKGIAV
jgi:hypothetical protein